MGRARDAHAPEEDAMKRTVVTILFSVIALGAASAQPCASPANEDCAGAESITFAQLPLTVTGIVGCSNDVSDKPYFDLFYRYDCTVTGMYQLDMCGSFGDTHLRVYTDGTQLIALYTDEVRDTFEPPCLGLVTGWLASLTATTPSSTLATPELPVTVESISGPKNRVKKRPKPLRFTTTSVSRCSTVAARSSPGTSIGRRCLLKPGPSRRWASPVPCPTAMRPAG